MMEFWFWFLVVVPSFILIYCAETGKIGFATLTLIVSLVLMNYLLGVPIVQYAINNPLWLIIYAFLYACSGGLWAIAKWWFLVKNEKELYDEFKEKFIKNHRLTISVKDAIPDELKKTWANEVNCYYEDDRKLDVNPKCSNYKLEITNWIAYWPWSLVWTLINDPIKKIANKIYQGIKKTLDNISDRIFKNTKQDFQ